MKDKFTVDFNRLAEKVRPHQFYRLADVEHRIERVAYDLVRFRDNEDMDQLWKIEDSSDGPVIVALYSNDNTETEKVSSDWEAVSDKRAMHIYYKGEPLVSLSSEQLGIPANEFGTVRRWLPKKLAEDEEVQKAIFQKVASPVRKVIVQRFPELTKVAAFDPDPTDDWEEEMDETEQQRSSELLPTEEEMADWNWDDEEMEMRELGDPFRPGGREGGREREDFSGRLMPEEELPEEDLESDIASVLSLLRKKEIDPSRAREILRAMRGEAEE